jgi:arsenate reductase
MARHFSSEFAMKLYGIPNCSTVKKARAWLEARDIPYEFHDFKKQGVPETLMRELCRLLGWESLINRNGPTWRKLPEDRRARVLDADSALVLMLENASVIRRPILDRDGQYQVGFSEENYGAFFGE